jgi:hypothetical protein
LIGVENYGYPAHAQVCFAELECWKSNDARGWEKE